MNSKLQNRQIVRRIHHSIQGPAVHNPQTPTQTNDLDQSYTHMHISSPLLRSLFLPANQFLQVCISIVSFFFLFCLTFWLPFFFPLLFYFHPPLVSWYFLLVLFFLLCSALPIPVLPSPIQPYPALSTFVLSTSSSLRSSLVAKLTKSENETLSTGTIFSLSPSFCYFISASILLIPLDQQFNVLIISLFLYLSHLHPLHFHRHSHYA